MFVYYFGHAAIFKTSELFERLFGLAGLDQSKINQENSLYSILASILGTKQEDYTSLGKTTGDAKIGVGT